MASHDRYVDRYLAEGDPVDDLGNLIQEKFREVVGFHKGFKWALGIPRRLGGDATGAELSEDKKVLKKLIYLYANLTERWALNGIELDRPSDDVPPSAQAFGAQVRFPAWITEQIIVVEAEKVEMTTAALHSNDRRAANKVVAALDQESITLARVREKFWG